MNHAEIKKENNIFVGYVDGQAITSAATIAKCIKKLSKYVGSQS